MQVGKASVRFEKPPVIEAAASIAGKKEGEGPLGKMIDLVVEDAMFGTDNWEQAESTLQKKTALMAMEKGGLQRRISAICSPGFAGAADCHFFGLMDLEVPLFGLYGACSTMGESLSLGAMTVQAGYAERVMAVASSHFATAEKQFRFPLAYGNQRPFSATWTVTGCGAVVLSAEGKKGMARVAGITTGRIVDMGATDSMNMGAAMAPSAYHTIRQNFEDMDVNETYYDKIITGDLGEIGRKILLDFMKKDGYDLEDVHMDCGMEIFDKESQDTHAGGSGCGCAAVTLCSMILPKIQDGTWKRVLFVPTGALLSTVSFNEGQSILYAHGVMLEHID
ncbi:MAG: stage V sporulation protein AD [Hungatella hathewayi]